MNTVLFQECVRYNRMLKIMDESLKNVSQNVFAQQKRKNENMFLAALGTSHMVVASKFGLVRDTSELFAP